MKEDYGKMAAVGEIAEGTVTGVMPFGAFVDLGGGKTGLIHISEISGEYVEDINEHIKKGDKVKVRVLKIDRDGKMSLSLKRAAEEHSKPRGRQAEKQNRRARPDDFDWSRRNDEQMSFEDKLSRFKQISDENMQAIRRSAENKRSGGYSRRGRY